MAGMVPLAMFKSAGILRHGGGELDEVPGNFLVLAVGRDGQSPARISHEDRVALDGRQVEVIPLIGEIGEVGLSLGDGPGADVADADLTLEECSMTKLVLSLKTIGSTTPAVTASTIHCSWARGFGGIEGEAGLVGIPVIAAALPDARQEGERQSGQPR